MIPQRNISLLSNRLAKEGGRRLREDVLERDYCLAWFLAALAESDLIGVLAFKGGTALKRCYFSDYRIFQTMSGKSWFFGGLLPLALGNSQALLRQANCLMK